MKTIIRVNLCNSCLLFLLICLGFISCKEKSSVETSFAIPENALTIEEASAVAGNTTSAQNSTSSDGSKIDYDLSSMNANMVYAEVFNMMAEPEIYDEKTVRMKGKFAAYPNSPTANGGTAYAVIITDALACCQTGIEFKYDFGGEVPKEGKEITVTGRYVTAFLSGDIAYNYVKADSVEM